MSRSCQRAMFSSPGLGVAAQDAGEAGDPLGADRVALVRHRRGALLAGGERLLDLAHLGPLQVADLGREALQAGAGDRDPRGEHGVAVARDRPGWRRPRAAARAAPSPAPRPRAAPRRRCRPRPRACRRRAARRRPRAGCRLRSASKAKPARRRPKVVGSAWTPWVRPTQSVSRCSSARSTQRVAVGAGAGERATSPASRSCSASAVSSTSEEVRP